jgi:hypothetical protein
MNRFNDRPAVTARYITDDTVDVEQQRGAG